MALREQLDVVTEEKIAMLEKFEQAGNKSVAEEEDKGKIATIETERLPESPDAEPSWVYLKDAPPKKEEKPELICETHGFEMEMQCQ